MTWLPREIMLTQHVTPEKALTTVRAELREGRLVGVCSTCLAATPALRTVLSPFPNLTYGYCGPHEAEALEKILRAVVEEPPHALTDESVRDLLTA